MKVLELDFPKNKKSKNGRHSWCFECCKASNRITYQKHKKHYLKRYAEYRKNHKESIAKYAKVYAKKNTIKRKYASLKCRHKTDDIPILSREEFTSWYKSQKKICFYCKITEENFRKKKIRGRSGKNLGVDKIVPKKGYIIGNIVLCCTVCNAIKSDIFTCKEMQEIAEKYIRPKWAVNRLLEKK